MSRFLAEAFMAVVLIGFGFSTLWYHDLYEQEQEKTVKALEKVSTLQEQITAAEANKPENLTIQANEFIKLLFASGEKDPQAHKKALSSLVTEKAYRELTKEPSEAHSEATGHLEGMKSEADIKESIYNRVSSTEGKVVVKFEHVLSKDGSVSKTLNEAVISLQYEADQWKVSEWELKPLF